jgi:hypothetical protein
MRRQRIFAIVFSTVFAVILPPTARADVFVVGQGSFPGFATLINFTGVADGTEVNDLTLGLVTFTYSSGNGNLIIDGGPGFTNNIAPPNIVSVGASDGVLHFIIPTYATMLGFGFAVLNTSSIQSAITISLWDVTADEFGPGGGVRPLGGLSFGAAPDPLFAGGFVGIRSTEPFNFVDVEFNSVAAPAFAVDNIRFANVVAPEPATFALVAIGLGSIGWSSRRRRRN